TWMAENLRYLPSVNEVNTISNEVPYRYVYGYSGTDVEEAKASENYDIYGVLYNYEAAKDACPSGWRTASDQDWTVLTDHLGGEEVAGRKLKEAGIDHWNFFNLSNADNESGFTALPGGSNWEAEFVARGGTSYFWTSTGNPQNQNHAWRRGMSASTESVNREDNGKRFGMSVRCIKN
ncbi:MAG: fibrobacter succinogenes major paralogous domain-containing protein, partial [Flavobacteriales bacterium]|nr:fibrobacter succinogenes major paralogous domain-containing protein [Flavobacteriales bacterium]